MAKLEFSLRDFQLFLTLLYTDVKNLARIT